MEPTAIQLRAARLWPARADAPELDAIREAWARRRDGPFPGTFTDWLGALDLDDDADLALIACLRDAATRTAESRLGLQPKVSELIVALMLHAFERHVCRHAGAHAEVDALGARLRHIDEPLAAQVIAACLTGQGLLLMASSDGAEPEAEPVNVIQGLPPEVLLQRDGKAAVRLEVDAHLQAMRRVSDKGSLQQRRAAARQRQRGPRGEAAIAMDVKQFKRDWNAGLMFVVPDAQAPAALKDPDVCDYAARTLGVGVWRYGGGGDAGADEAWSDVVANVAEPLREAIGALFPRAVGVPLAAPAGLAPQVFLSYAHDAEDAALVQQVRTTLDALAAHGHVRLWIDSQGIRTGQAFHPDIQAGIDASRVAIVLVSKHLLKSDYVTRHELPHILKRRDGGQITFCPVLLGNCDRDAVPHFADVNFKFGVTALRALQDQPHRLDDQLAALSRWLREHLAGKAL